MKIRKSHAEEALLVQSAVNLSGVVHSFSRIIKEIWEDYYEEVKKLVREENNSMAPSWHPNSHPVCVLFAIQIEHLTCQSSLVPMRSYNESYELCWEAKENDQNYIEVV